MRFTRVITLALSMLAIYPVALLLPVAAQESVSSLPPATEDPKTAALRQQIQGYYNEMDQALEKMDIAASWKYIAPDCKVILRDGTKFNVKGAKEAANALYKKSIKTEAKNEITVFSMKGDTATVETRVFQLLRYRNDQGIESDIEIAGQGRDFWMKTKAGWRIKQTRETDRTLKVNGQIIQE